jgi:hypothetical protein
MNINLHIDRLILDGMNIPHGQRHLLQASVQTELVRLFTEGGISDSLTSDDALSDVSASGIKLSNGNDPVQLGRKIARSVYGGIGK